MGLNCHSCNKPSDYLERINATGQDGLFYCAACAHDHYAAIQSLKEMSVEELELVEFAPVKWICSGKGCNRGTHARDYGINPEFWHPRKSIHWFNILHNFWMCERHYKLYRRLIKNYDRDAVFKKLFDFTKEKIVKTNK